MYANMESMQEDGTKQLKKEMLQLRLIARCSAGDWYKRKLKSWNNVACKMENNNSWAFGQPDVNMHRQENLMDVKEQCLSLIIHLD